METLEDRSSFKRPVETTYIGIYNLTITIRIPAFTNKLTHCYYSLINYP